MGAITSGTPSTTSAVSLGLVITSITNAPEHDERVPQRERCRRPDHLLEERRIVGEPRDHFAGAHGLEESGRLLEQVPEHRAADVGRDALADPGHRVEARIRGGGEHAHDREQREERRVERGRVGAREAGVDDALQALAEHQHAARRDHERDARRRPCAPVYGATKRRTRASCRTSRLRGALGRLSICRAMRCLSLRAAPRSSTIQCLTGSPVPACRCAWQPMLAGDDLLGLARGERRELVRPQALGSSGSRIE